jgi:hypothetical protein
MGRFAHLLQNNVFADAHSGSFVLHAPLAAHIHRELGDRHIFSSSPVVHCLQKNAPSSDRGCGCPDELLVSFQPSLATQHFFQQVEGPLVDLQIIDEDDERTFDEHKEDKMMIEAHLEGFVFDGDDDDNRKIKDDLTVDTDDSDAATSVSSRVLDHELETEEDSPLWDSDKKRLADVKANFAAEEKKKELEDKEAKELRKAALEEKIAALKAKVSQLENTQNARPKILLAPALGPRVLPTSPFRPKKEVPRPKNGAVPLLDFSSVCFTHHVDDTLETPGRKLTRDIEKELAFIKVPIFPVCPKKNCAHNICVACTFLTASSTDLSTFYDCT